MPEAPVPSAIELHDVEKQYGALRPLRIRDLRIAAGSRAMLVGFDRPAAETFVNLVTGATLPDKGEVLSLGRRTSDISDSDAWLAFVERFGFISDRAVLLDGMTVAQNLAIPFDLEVYPIPANVLQRVAQLAAEVDIDKSVFDAPVAEAGPTLRAKVRVARALALDPAVLLLEHPTATLPQEDLKAYSALIKRISERREITIVGLTMDEKFGKALDGRLLSWQPATGEFRERRGWF
jgi:ABC-type transporter Mla maintaining outer membrane lipid asymmetry ATPase subunit MlaF